MSWLYLATELLYHYSVEHCKDSLPSKGRNCTSSQCWMTNLVVWDCSPQFYTSVSGSIVPGYVMFLAVYRDALIFLYLWISAQLHNLPSLTIPLWMAVLNLEVVAPIFCKYIFAWVGRLDLHTLTVNLIISMRVSNLVAMKVTYLTTPIVGSTCRLTGWSVYKRTHVSLNTIVFQALIICTKIMRLSIFFSGSTCIFPHYIPVIMSLCLFSQLFTAYPF